MPWEARPFQGQRAGVVTRTAANIVDFAVVVGLVSFGYAALCAARFLVNARQFTFPGPSWRLLLGCFAFLLFAYLTMCWATTGRTYGDHVLGLRIVGRGGEGPGWTRAAIRAGFCVVLPVGLYWAVVSPTNRSVQDSALGTSVLYDWTTRRQRRGQA